MAPSHLEPMSQRRRRETPGSKIGGLLKSWRVLVFAAAVILTTLNLNRSLSSHHQRHVSKGVTRRQLPQTTVGNGSNVVAASHGDPLRTSQHKGAESLGAAAMLRGKAQQRKKQLRMRHARGGGSAGGGASDDAAATGSTVRRCHIQDHAEYAGDVVKWGQDHEQTTADECCEACRSNEMCNVWVYCGSTDGCGGDRQHRECWLKHQEQLNLLNIDGSVGGGSPWTSGAVYSEAEKAAALAAVSEQERKEAARLLALKNNESLPLVYFDVEIKGEPIGRMLFVLFIDEAPLAAENFRQLCTGEKGIVPKGREGGGLPYSFKDKVFYRIIDRFIDQTGADTESIYGGMFKDDPGGLKLKHNRKGLLSAANMGPDTNTSHFSILVAPAPHLNGKYTIFGELVSGWEVAARINKLSLGKPDNTAGRGDGAKIVDVGQLREGAGNHVALAALMKAQTTLVH